MTDDIQARLTRTEQKLADIDEKGSRGLITLESRVARNEQRLEDLDMKVNAMIPLATNVIQLTERVEVLRRDLREYAAQVQKIDEEIEDKEKQLQKERRETRRAFYVLTTTIVCALITALAVVISAGIH